MEKNKKINLKSSIAIAGLIIFGCISGLLLAEVLSRLISSQKKFVVKTENSVEKDYWYYRYFPGHNKINLANKYGFIGETESAPSAFRVLVLGDSLVNTALREKSFAKIAEKSLNKENSKAPVFIMNAGIPGYSTEQIQRFYSKNLKGLHSNLTILVFYIDDINRALRYRINGNLYTHLWPKLIQDIYHEYCVVCRRLANFCGFNERYFLTSRLGTYEQTLPNAKASILKIADLARERKQHFAIFGIPRFTWKGRLGGEKRYRYLDLNNEIHSWMKNQQIPYYDLLPMLAEEEIEKLRISDDDIHFNPRGHDYVAQYFANFIKANRQMHP